jgi:trans-2,3-dihydro-3-hydroxyanthranilate isomerase
MNPLHGVHPLPVPGTMPDGRRRIPIKQVDAFTDMPLTGNAAGVVADASGLTDEQMQVIAREIAVPETSFVLPPGTPAADVRIRWFTPQAEVSLCGHATIAAFHALAEDGAFNMGSVGNYTFRLETKSGILPVEVCKSAEVIHVWFGLTVPEFSRAGQYKLDVMRILNITLEEFEQRLPIVSADKYLYVPLRRLHSIFSMKPNFFAMSQFLANRNLIGLCVFTQETVDKDSSVHSRFFAPSIGINEDPVTGSANGPLGVYLFENGLVQPSNGVVSIVGEQGDVIGRKGRVKIQVAVNDTHVLSVRIGGRAVTVLRGELLAS